MEGSQVENAPLPQTSAPVFEAEVTMPPPPGKRRRSAAWVTQRVAELFTVFVGVYAAFLLNAHQQHRQEQQRRAQLLNWLERVYTEERDSIRREAVNLQTIADRFNGDLAAGNRPALHSFDWISRLYSR